MARRKETHSSHIKDVTRTMPTKVKGGGYALLLYFTGIGLAGTGVAFALAPRISWQLTKVVRKLAPYGIENGTLVVGGLVIFTLGWVVRAMVRAAESGALQSPDMDAEAKPRHRSTGRRPSGLPEHAIDPDGPGLDAGPGPAAHDRHRRGPARGGERPWQ